jgi:hypothetical protein
VALFAVVGCQQGPAPPDFAAKVPDLGAPSPDDLAVDDPNLPPGVGPDLAGPAADLAGPPPDLALSPPPGSLVWPPGQSFPSFPPFDSLDVIDVTGLAADQETLVVTLAGLVNRQKPRIYTLDGGGEGKTFWLDQLNVAKTTVTDPLALVAKYRGEIAGVVVPDPAVADTLNVATTIAGIKGGVVASPELAATLGAPPYKLPVLVDLRANHFANKLDVYQYELAQWGALASRRIICGLNPTVPGHLRDYAVATASLMVWLDPRNADEKALLASILGTLQPLSPYLGWWADEGSGVGAASTASVPVFAADWGSNLTVFGGTPRGIQVPAAPPMPALENKVYVALIMSDGDNVQENEHLIPVKWRDPNRGKVPIAWTTSPALVDVAPMILNYYWATATAKDVMISGPSGLGYTYPEWWADAAFNDYAVRSGAYLKAAGLRAITIWNKDPANMFNDGKDLSAADATAYVSAMPSLLGVTLQGGWIRLLKESTILDGKLPLMRLAQTYGSNETDLESGIDTGTLLWAHLSPLFIAVQGNMNNDNINPTTFYNVQQHYASNSDYVFVRLDHFFQLMRQANQLPVDP